VNRKNRQTVVGLVAFVGVLCAVCTQGFARQEVVLRFQQGVDGYAATRAVQIQVTSWNTSSSRTGALSMGCANVGTHSLLAFGDVAGPVCEQLARGYRIKSARIELRWLGTSGDPNRRWHVQAWALRQPWADDPGFGPTWNAYVNGLGYWRMSGAKDPEHDRYPEPLGQDEVSKEHPQGSIDITAVLTDPQYGKSVGERLRNFEARGVLLIKAETEGYAGWGISVAAPGHNEAAFRPRLVIEFQPDSTAAKEPPELPDAFQFQAFADRLEQMGGDGKPTCAMPEGFQEKVWRAPEFPDEPAWQRQRRRELLNLPVVGPLGQVMRGMDKGTEQGYMEAHAAALTLGAHLWRGWATIDWAMVYPRYYDVMVPEAQRWLDEFFRFWIMPQSEERANWWRTRSGWIWGHQPEVLWNHPAMGHALSILGGQICGSERVVKQGAADLAQFLAQCAEMSSISEYVAHYYNCMSLTHFMAIAQDAHDPYTRLIADILSERLLLDYVERYHPGTRQLCGPFARTQLQYVIGAQCGINYVLHSLSESGALIEDEGLVPAGLPMYSTTGTAPERVALVQVWPGDVARNLTDHKELPYSVRSFSRWRRKKDETHRLTWYLSPYYSIGSTDLSSTTITIDYDLVGHWQRTTKQVSSLKDRCTIWTRYVFNDRDGFAQRTYHKQGKITVQGPGNFWRDGVFWSLQHRNKVIFVDAPSIDEDGHVQSMKSAVFVSRFGREIEQIWVAGKRVTQLPARARFKEPILLKDGPAFAALIPLEATDLGRKDEVTISIQEPHLVFSAYNFQSDQPRELGAEAYAGAHGGWVLELGDVSQYPTFAEFKKHISSAELIQEQRGDVIHIEYRSGGDVMEFGYRPMEEPIESGRDYWLPGVSDCIVYQRVNGKSPHLPDGIVRESNTCVQGMTGRLEKNGVVLTTDPRPTMEVRGKDVRAQWWLINEPVSGIIEVVNAMEIPSSMKLEAPGLVARCEKFPLGRLTLDPQRGVIRVDAFGAAPIEVSGIDLKKVLVNRKPLDIKGLQKFEADGKSWIRIPTPPR